MPKNSRGGFLLAFSCASLFPTFSFGDDVADLADALVEAVQNNAGKEKMFSNNYGGDNHTDV